MRPVLAGIAMIGAAFGASSLRGFRVSDEQYMAAEEDFSDAVGEFDRADDCEEKRKWIKKMEESYLASGLDSDLRKIYAMRKGKYRWDCR
jgi:hypothetical protein